MRGFRVVLALVLGITLVGAVPAQASGGPLPGYTISNPPLTPAVVGGEPAKVLQGVHSHAGYAIEVPPRWNGKLAMWAHGYRGQGTVLTVDPPAYGLRQQLLDQGYAWAASSYSTNGYDVGAGVTTTRELATLFGTLVQQPTQVFIAGVSMGGQVIGRSLEEYPGFYSGALPMCGVLGDHELFDRFLDYQLVAQDLADVPAYPAPADYLTNAVPKIQQALGMTSLQPGGPDTLNPLGSQLRAITVNQTGGIRPGANAAFAYWKDFLFGLGAPPTGGSLAQDPGQIATNLFTRYRPNSPVEVNRTVQRVPVKNPLARFSPALSANPQIFGVPTAPVLSLHGLGDLFVPFAMEQVYRDDVARHGKTQLLAQRAIRTTAHCEFGAKEVGTAWNDLVRWVGTGWRPAADVVDDPEVVASAGYGCGFTDPAAYPSGTRGFFPPCPAS